MISREQVRSNLLPSGEFGSEMDHFYSSICDNPRNLQTKTPQPPALTHAARLHTLCVSHEKSDCYL